MPMHQRWQDIVTTIAWVAGGVRWTDTLTFTSYTRLAVRQAMPSGLPQRRVV